VTRPTIRDGKAYYKLADIRPHPENYNRHSPEQVKLLKASLEKYGQTKPVVLWRNAEFNGQNGIPGDKWLSLAGEGLCEAAMQLDWQEVWGNDRSDLSVLEARAYLAVDNETARQADPDIDALSQLLAAVHAEDESLAALAAGGEDELRRLLEMASAPPTLDELADKYGEPNERDFWPVVRVQVSPETFQAFNSLMAQIPGEDEALKFAHLLDAVDATVLGAKLS